MTCFACAFHVFIDTTGELRLCCYYQNRPKEHTYGQLGRESLCQLWHSEAHRAALRAIDPDKCQIYDCKYFAYNQVFHEGLAQDASCAGVWALLTT
jgi:hypothetical protein